MADTAHIATLLPTQNRVVGVDENTVFLAHYDLNEHDVLRNVKAVGSSYELSLNGSNIWASLPLTSWPQTLTTISVEFWGMPTENKSTSVLFNSQDNSSNRFNIHFPWNNGTIYWDFGDITSNGRLTVAADTSWYNMMAYWVFTAGNGYMKIYRNGIEIASKTDAGSFSPSGMNLQIGRYNPPGADTYWHGNIKGLRMWNRILSPSEITSLMNSSSLVSESGLIGWWKLNEGTGSIIRDYSPFHNDGVAYNPYWVSSNSVFTIRNREGYFGGSAIAIEDGTTNLITRPIDSYPSIGNGWGTYQTNQYNNSNFFSIGAVTDVTNNVVTYDGTWPLYTYDVIRPQTTGGGVTANTDYFVKKLSATTFTLHVYDSSQDGSKGFRVHDVINNDIRIPLTLSGFPTMWWGAPHMPNSGLVKEIISNGFTNNGTTHDCLRMHTEYHQADNAHFGDYLAYGVTPSVTSGNTYTFSFYARAVSNNAVGATIYPGYWTNGSSWGGGSITLSKNWQRYSWTGTAPATGGTNFYLNIAQGTIWDIAEIQVEQKAFPTSYTSGTRTKGLLCYPNILQRTFTISFWTYLNSTSGSGVNDNKAFVSLTDTTQDFQFYLARFANGNLTLWGRKTDGSVGAVIDSGTQIPINTWHHIALVGNGNNVTLYLNGASVGTATNYDIDYVLTNIKRMYIGCEDPAQNGANYRVINALIDELRIDNIARTDAEIAAWYFCGGPFYPRGIYRKSY